MLNVIQLWINCESSTVDLYSTVGDGDPLLLWSFTEIMLSSPQLQMGSSTMAMWASFIPTPWVQMRWRLLPCRSFLRNWRKNMATPCTSEDGMTALEKVRDRQSLFVTENNSAFCCTWNMGFWYSHKVPHIMATYCNFDGDSFTDIPPVMQL